MARLFAAGGTDRLSWGSDAKLDNLAQGSFTAWAVVRRNSTAANLWIAGKGAAGSIATQGWQFLLDQYPGGSAAPGHLRLILGRATVHTDVWSGNASGVDVVPLNQHYFVAVSWNGAAATFYAAPFETPVSAAATANTINSAGSGAFGADATADLWVGNSVAGGGAAEFGGDIDWCGAHNVALTRAQLRQIQQGLLAYNAGSTTRGAAMVNGVAGCVLAGKLNSGGTAIDISASPATGTFVGTDPGMALGNIYVFDAFGDDLWQYATASGSLLDRTAYLQVSGYARTGLLATLATGGTLWLYRSIRADEAAQADVGLVVDGAYTDTLTSATINELSADTFAGLSAASKTLEFVAGPRSRPGGLPAEGTWPTLVVLNASAVQAAPVEGTSRLHYLSESTVEGFFTDPPAQYSPAATFRANLPTGFDGIASFAYGGMTVADIAGDATLRAETAAVLTAGNPRAIWISIGMNDKLQNTTLSTLSTQLTALVQAILDTVAFTGTIYLGAPLITLNYEGANAASVPYTADQLRAEELAIATGFASPRVVGINMRDWVTTAQLDADGTHLTNVSGPIVGNQMALAVAESAITGDIAAASETHAAAVGSLRLAGALSAGGETAAAATGALRIVGTVAASSEGGAAVDADLRLTGTVTAASESYADLAGEDAPVVGTIEAGTETRADAMGVLRLTGAATSGSETAAAIAGRLRLVGTVEASTEGGSAVAGSQRLSGTVAAESEAGADVAAVLRLLAEIAATSETGAFATSSPLGTPGPHPLSVAFTRMEKSVAFTPITRTVEFT
ncbi:MAG: hypothetical protein ACYC0B_02160 [Gemmatimonadaceae bacterium]